MKSFMLVVLAMLGSAIVALCQTGTATISGRIADPTGAALSGANVQIENVATGQVTSLKTNSSASVVTSKAAM
jgi:hypothetical protein